MNRPTIILLLSICSFFCKLSNTSAKGIHDTIPVKHSTDAVLDDWDPSSFDLHEPSGIHMAIENDTEKLYVAMYVTKREVQKILALAGVRLLIDVKGKKKEATYIEFPLQKDPQTAALAIAEMENNESGNPDQLSKHMFLLKKNGFKNQLQETEIQAITAPTDIQISFGWDEKSVLYIEYEIPFKSITDYTTLKNKEITVGFKINALEVPPPEPKSVVTTTKIVAIPVGSISPSNFRTPSNRDFSKVATTKALSQQQSFWMKHQVN